MSPSCPSRRADRPCPTLNCDLGEGEPPARTRALMALIDAANIACGGHAGDDDSMRACLAWAREFGVHAGAHPGRVDGQAFGRGALDPMTLSPEDLVSLLRVQIGRLAEHAAALGLAVSHVKLHGALYHATDADPRLARAYVTEVGRAHPGLRIFARAGGRVEAEARNRGVPVCAEAFLDRGYRADGTLVPRGQPGALLEAPAEILQRLEDLRQHGGWWSVDGPWVPLEPGTLCVHGDTPGALDLLRPAHEALADWARSPVRRQRNRG